MWGGTFLAALLTLLMRNTPSGHGRSRDNEASEPLLDAPKPFSKAHSVVKSLSWTPAAKLITDMSDMPQFNAPATVWWSLFK